MQEDPWFDGVCVCVSFLFVLFYFGEGLLLFMSVEGEWRVWCVVWRHTHTHTHTHTLCLLGRSRCAWVEEMSSSIKCRGGVGWLLCVCMFCMCVCLWMEKGKCRCCEEGRVGRGRTHTHGITRTPSFFRYATTPPPVLQTHPQEMSFPQQHKSPRRPSGHAEIKSLMLRAGAAGYWLVVVGGWCVCVCVEVIDGKNAYTHTHTKINASSFFSFFLHINKQRLSHTHIHTHWLKISISLPTLHLHFIGFSSASSPLVLNFSACLCVCVCVCVCVCMWRAHAWCFFSL